MSYYSLPSIKCNERKNLKGNVFTNDKDKCLKLNPDIIYTELFPKFNDPLSKFNNINGSGKNEINTYNNISKKTCATNCLLNNSEKKSNFFSYNDNIQKCFLYNIDNPQTVNMNNNNNNNIQTTLYKKKSVSGCVDDPDCIGCQNLCDTNNINNYEKISNNISILPTSDSAKINNYLVNSLNECQEKCNNNSDCKSIFYKNIPSKCTLYKNKKTSTDTTNTTDNTLYEINKESLNNKINMNYLPYYSNYTTKVGDYTCEYNNDSNTCYEISQKKCINCNKQPTTNENIIPIYNYPLNNSIDNSSSSNNDSSSNSTGTVGINGFTFNKCLKNNSCIGSVYTYDNLGFPKKDRTANPPTENYMISNSFDKKHNHTFINCPNEWTPNVDGNKCIKMNGELKTCNPDNIENTDDTENCNYSNNDNSLLKRRPKDTAFNNIEGCKKWCDDNGDCFGISSTIKNGNIKCNYYNKNMIDKTSNVISSANYDLYTKNTQKDNYIYNIKSYTESLIDNDIPLTPSLTQIMYPNESNQSNENYYYFTKCINENNASKQCQLEFGDGYIANTNISKKCDSKNELSRYMCELDPTKNNFITNFIPNLNKYEYFTNNILTFTPNWLIIFIIILILIVIILFFKYS